MKEQRERQRSEAKDVARVKPRADPHVKRVDMELPDGRYLLVYSPGRHA